MRSVFLALFVAASSVLPAQSTETPTPFDSARHLLSITPAFADRLKLSPPAWPVSGTYQEARLYSIDPGDGFVLVVQLPSGAFQRFPLSAGERQSLGFTIDSALRTTGRLGASAMSISEPAGNSFARHQEIGRAHV